MAFNAVNVENHKVRFDINIYGWNLLFALGCKYGWKPQGTQRPQHITSHKWGGRYDTNDGQIVTAEDAKEWGRSIKKAIETNPAITIVGDNLLSRFSKERLLSFVNLCDAGGFEIW